MGWESGRAAYREVPGTQHPVTFKCTTLALVAHLFTAAAFLGGFYWMSGRQDSMAWFFCSPFFLGACGLFIAGCLQLFVYRRIEIYSRERKLVSLKRIPFGGVTREVYGFDQLRRISATLIEPGEDHRGGGVVVILTTDGRDIDFGNQTFDRGGRLVARLHALTGLPVGM